MFLEVLSPCWSTCRLSHSMPSWGGGLIVIPGFTSFTTLNTTIPFLSFSWMPSTHWAVPQAPISSNSKLSTIKLLYFKPQFHPLPLPTAQPHMHHPPYSMPQLPAPPRAQGPLPPFYLLHLIFLLGAVVATQAPDESHMLCELGWVRGAPGHQELNCTSCSARREGPLRQRHLCDFQGPNQERKEGLFPRPAPDWPGPPQWAVTGRNGEGCLPPASVSHRKTNPATSCSWR